MTDSICWFTYQMFLITGAGPGQATARSLGLHPDHPHGWQGLQYGATILCRLPEGTFAEAGIGRHSIPYPQAL